MNQSNLDLYKTKFSKSGALYERAKGLLPRGVTHDAWFILPFPIYIARALGSRKWDVDGYEYVDYFGGHGALMLGHSHPSLVEAVNRQIEMGTHYGGCHELQLEWAEIIKSLVPSAELVEFTNSGTEANMLSIRLARAFTGRNRIIRFRGHFAGFSDPVMVGTQPPWDIPTSKGILPADVENTTIIPINDEEALEQTLSKEDAAILMVEAAGEFSGVTGIAPSFYKAMKELTGKYGTLLHFDEVVTGFRYSPGGVQAAIGITPDLTSLGKIVTGGMPGAGAVVGRADVMEMFAFKDDKWNRYQRVSHPGTFNGNPLCAATGIATLKIIATGEPIRQANKTTRLIKEGMQRALEERGLPGCVYGEYSMFHIYLGDCEFCESCQKVVCLNDKKERPAELGQALALHFVLNGIHMPSRGYDGIVSAAHGVEDGERTIRAFGASLDSLIGEGMIP